MLGAGILAATIGCGVSNSGGTSNSADEVHNTSQPINNGVYVSFDLDLPVDATALIQRADLVVHGIPIGNIEITPPKDIGLYSEYYQDFKVLSVLKGKTSESFLRVRRIGVDRVELDKITRRDNVAVIVDDEGQFPGALTQGPQILFLADIGNGRFNVVGFRQGTFLLGPDGRVSSALEFKSFEGLDVSQVKQRIEELSQS